MKLKQLQVTRHPLPQLIKSNKNRDYRLLRYKGERKEDIKNNSTDFGPAPMTPFHCFCLSMG